MTTRPTLDDDVPHDGATDDRPPEDDVPPAIQSSPVAEDTSWGSGQPSDTAGKHLQSLLAAIENDLSPPGSDHSASERPYRSAGSQPTEDAARTPNQVLHRSSLLDSPDSSDATTAAPGEASELAAALAGLRGTILENRYRMGRMLGSGGMGAVFEARHLRLDRPVAIKVLRPAFATEKEHIARFLREAKSASKIRHRNVVELLDYGETANGLVYSVMELLVGQDLERLLRAQPEGRLPWEHACGLLIQITSGLKAAHSQGVIHRDIKPANCFLTEEDGEPVVKLVDFGLARLEGSDRGHTLTGTAQILGTPSYIAPELVRSQVPASPRSDIYSLGMVAYRMLVGMVPFTASTVFEVLRKACFDPVPSLREQVPEIPDEVEALVLEMLAKDPSQRPMDMLEVRNRLEALRRRTLGARAMVIPSSLPLNVMESLPPSLGTRSSRSPSRLGETVPAVGEATLRGIEASGTIERPRGRRGLWLVLGSVGVLAVAGALVVPGMRGGDDKTESNVAEVATVPVKPARGEERPAADEPEVHNDADSAAEMLDLTSTGDEEDDDAMLADDEPTDVGDPEVPLEPEPRGESAPRRPKASSRVPTGPPADSVVTKRLERKIAKECAKELSGGSVTVKFLVTVSGEIMGLTATGSAVQCAMSQVQGAKFRERPTSAPIKITVGG